MAEKESENHGEVTISAASWERAKVIAQKIGKTPSLFSACIRSLTAADSIIEDASNIEGVKDGALKSTEALLTISPTLVSVFFQAAQDRHPEALSALGGQISINSLLRIFSLREVAGILSVTFLYRRARKLCEQSEFAIIKKKLFQQIQITCLVGSEMQQIGSDGAILIGSIRYLALAAIATCEIEDYKKFKKKARSKQQLFFPNLELESFGCNHLQVASFLCSELGFSAPRSAIGLSLAMFAVDADDQSLTPKLRQEALSMRGAMIYSEALQATGSLPKDLTVAGYSLSLDQERQASLEDRAKEISEDSSLLWLDASPEQLPESVAIQLIKHHDKKHSNDNDSKSAQDIFS